MVASVGGVPAPDSRKRRLSALGVDPDGPDDARADHGNLDGRVGRQVGVPAVTRSDAVDERRRGLGATNAEATRLHKDGLAQQQVFAAAGSVDQPRRRHLLARVRVDPADHLHVDPPLEPVVPGADVRVPVPLWVAQPRGDHRSGRSRVLEIKLHAVGDPLF